MDRGAWQAMVHRVTKSQTQRSDLARIYLFCQLIFEMIPSLFILVYHKQCCMNYLPCTHVCEHMC